MLKDVAPGPWRANGAMIYDKSGAHVCTVNQADANRARKITRHATAMPQLLDAFTKTHKALEQLFKTKKLNKAEFDLAHNALVRNRLLLQEVNGIEPIGSESMKADRGLGLDSRTREK